MPEAKPSSSSLNELEIKVLEALQAPEQPHGLLAALLQQGLQPHELQEDDEGPPTSALELAWLVLSRWDDAALRSKLGHHTREQDLPEAEWGAYTLSAASTEKAAPQRAIVWPSFARALACKDLVAHPAPDLWAMDVEIWRLAQESAAPAEQAIQWLTSPGRRLSFDLSILKEPPDTSTQTQHGATDWTLPRLYAAAGVYASNKEAPRWLELHRCIPQHLDRWQPRDGKIERALWALQEESPPGLQAGALRWLLDEAARQPVASIGSHYKTNLRELVQSLIAAALPPEVLKPAEDAPHRPKLETVGAALERTLLEHAAHLLQGDPDADDAAHWHVARWLYTCITHSPFHSAAESILNARLRALLPAKATRPKHAPLAAACIQRELPLRPLLLAEAIIGHYRSPTLNPLYPTPLPVADLLRAIAHLALPPALQPSLPAPPLQAREAMTRDGLPWLNTAEALPVLESSIECLLDDPDTFAWVAEAIYREGDTLPPALHARARALWSQLTAPPHDAFPAHLAALIGLALRGRQSLPAGDDPKLLDRIDRAEPAWQAALISSWLERLRPGEEPATVLLLLERLLILMERSDVPASTRLNAALFAARGLQRVARGPLPDEARPLATRLMTLTSQPPLRDHAALQRELRRVGFTPS